MPSRIWTLSKSFLSSPSRAAQASQDEKSLAPCLWVFLAFTVGTMLFFIMKPADFPDQSAANAREVQGLMFWLKVMLWQPPLEAAWMAFLLALVAWFRQGALPVRLTSAVAWTAAPFILMAVNSAQGAGPAISTATLVLGSAAWLSLFVPLWRRLTRAEVLPVVTFMLGINAIGIVMLAPMVLAALVRSPNLFMATQVVGGFWMLAWGTLGLRQLTGLRLPRAFMAVLLSMFFQIAVALTLNRLGLVPKDILKALLYA
jgi:hypothetical protein